MIEITRTPLQVRDWQVKVVGVGGAGSHAVDHLCREGIAGADLIVANTDARALTSCLTSVRISLGQRLTRGLGAGGDPDLGRAAVEESLANVSEQLAGASMLILLTGLGGGTGSGSAPRIAQVARDQGAHVVVLATMPFSFEGKRRSEQAAEGLAALRQHADLVICFENERMSSLVDASAGIEEAFTTVDTLLAQAVRALVAMSQRRGLLHSGIDEIAAALSVPHSSALFGYGAAEGDERVREALDQALASPLFEQNERLNSASGVWMYVAGGSDLRWAEVQLITTELNQRLPSDVRLFFGAAVDPHLAGSISVTLLAGVPCVGTELAVHSRGSAVSAATSELLIVADSVEASELPSHDSEPAEFEPVPTEEEALIPRVEEPALEPDLEVPELQSPEVSAPEEIALPPQKDPRPLPEPATPGRAPFELAAEMRRDIGASFLKRRLLARAAHSEQASAEADLPQTTEAVQEKPSSPASTVSSVAPEPEAPKASTSSASPESHDGQETTLAVSATRKKPAQEQMHFEPVNRGRFEKTDPTMVDGQDLDVPTFLRRRVSIGGEGSPSSTEH